MKNTRLSKHFMLAEFLNQGKYPLRPTPPLRPHRVLQVTAIPGTRQESRGLFFTQKVPSLLCYFYVILSP